MGNRTAGLPNSKSFFPLQQVSADDEMKNCERLFSSLIRCIEARREEVKAEVMDRQRGAERRAEKLVGELQRETAELRGRNAELEELLASEDHLHLLQVTSSSCGAFGIGGMGEQGNPNWGRRCETLKGRRAKDKER